MGIRYNELTFFMIQNSLLLTDFYQLSMAYGYWQLGMQDQEAVFHLFFRRNPQQSRYTIVAGLSELMKAMNDFCFSDSDIDYLRSIRDDKKPYFSEEFLSYLKTLAFTGNIDAVPEGTVLFPHEPLLRIQAPLLQCQLLETLIINTFNFASAVATMASNIRSLVPNGHLFEFGLRRAQGPNGGLTASRSAYLGGFDATSNVLAGKVYDIPVVGTMAHSWVMAFENEAAAFRAYSNVMPDNIILLVDTYDTIQGVKNAIAIGKQLEEKGYPLKGIRLDSGDLAILSVVARQLLDDAGFTSAKIYVSGELSLSKIAYLKNMRAPIDGWGVGTKLSTVYDQPALDMVYKLGAIKDTRQWRFTFKESDSPIKATNPGILQTRRYVDKSRWLGDTIYHLPAGIQSATVLSEAPYLDLLVPIIRAGKPVYTMPTLAESRDFCLSQAQAFHGSTEAEYLVQQDPCIQALKK